MGVIRDGRPSALCRGQSFGCPPTWVGGAFCPARPSFSCGRARAVAARAGQAHVPAASQYAIGSHSKSGFFGHNPDG